MNLKNKSFSLLKAESEKIGYHKKSFFFCSRVRRITFFFMLLCSIEMAVLSTFLETFDSSDEHSPYFISHNVCNESEKFIQFNFAQLNKSFVIWRWIMIKKFFDFTWNECLPSQRVCSFQNNPISMMKVEQKNEKLLCFSTMDKWFYAWKISIL